MPVCRKTEHPALVLLLATVLFAWPPELPAQTSGISIDRFTGGVEDTTYTVNATIHYQLSEETRDALEQGVPIEFDVMFRIRKDRRWLWDATISEKMLSYRIEYQPLGNHYLVTELSNGKRHQFRTLASGLEFIGNIQSFPLLSANSLQTSENWIAQIRSVLNIQSLPAPLRPLAYLSPQWRLASSWYNLEIRP